MAGTSDFVILRQQSDKSLVRLAHLGVPDTDNVFYDGSAAVAAYISHRLNPIAGTYFAIQNSGAEDSWQPWTVGVSTVPFSTVTEDVTAEPSDLDVDENS